MMTNDRTRFEKAVEVVKEQILALGIPGARAGDLTPDTLLVDELGLDSLKFVDLTVGLEDALGLDEFPMQEWVDEQLSARRPLTVGQLARACERVLPGASVA